MGLDEARTLRALRQHREIIDGLIVQHHGRIANTAGDSVLAEFPSVVDAVRCAVRIQESLAQAKDASPEHRLLFRIGVHVGDVMIQGGDLFGDGVNVAARLQALAEPGGIGLSQAAYDYVRKALPLHYADRGPQTIKRSAAAHIAIFGLRDRYGETAREAHHPRRWPRKPLGDSATAFRPSPLGGAPPRRNPENSPVSLRRALYGMPYVGGLLYPGKTGRSGMVHQAASI
jgi:hypothetical protein